MEHSTPTYSSRRKSERKTPGNPAVAQWPLVLPVARDIRAGMCSQAHYCCSPYLELPPLVFVLLLMAEVRLEG